MLSRRNIRIKIMQLLFSQNRDQELTNKNIVELYEQTLKKSFELYMYNLYILLQVAAYAQEDAKKRHAKYLPKPEDLLFSPKIFTNECTQSMVNNKPLNSYFRKLNFEERYDTDLTRKVYLEFSKLQEYSDYVYDDLSDTESHRQILLHLFKVIIKNELIAESLDDHYSNWQDDKSLIIGVMKKTLKSLPQDEAFFNEHQPEDDTTRDFGLTLLQNLLEKGESYKEANIQPVVENWDVERVAVIDMILLKMAVTEFFAFKSIPAKVTINEYMEISKQYSTDKSKDFINGILDKIYNGLLEAGELKGKLVE